jgi:hypothetical protein
MTWAESEKKLLSGVADMQRDVALHFAGRNLDNGAFERLGRYEMALWRQVRQTIFTLEGLAKPNLTPSRSALLAAKDRGTLDDAERSERR